MAAKTNLPLSWEDIERDAKALARRLAAHGPFRGIVAVSRGGLVPAAIVARALDIRLIETLCIKSYDDRAREPGSVEVLKGVSGDGEGLLIVDDLVDTGETARVVRGQLPRAHFATVYAKPLGRPFVDTVVTEVSQDTWIVFPWER